MQTRRAEQLLAEELTAAWGGVRRRLRRGARAVVGGRAADRRADRAAAARRGPARRRRPRRGRRAAPGAEHRQHARPRTGRRRPARAHAPTPTTAAPRGSRSRRPPGGACAAGATSAVGCSPVRCSRLSRRGPCRARGLAPCARAAPGGAGGARVSDVPARRPLSRPHLRVRDAPRGRRRRPERSPRRDVRPARAQRRRQDHDDPRAHHAAARGARRGAGVRPRRGARADDACAGSSATCRSSSPPRPRSPGART